MEPILNRDPGDESRGGGLSALCEAVTRMFFTDELLIERIERRRKTGRYVTSEDQWDHLVYLVCPGDEDEGDWDLVATLDKRFHTKELAECVAGALNAGRPS